MRVSVLIPVYNIRAYVPECVDSILSQTYPDLDVILIDDGSNDGSGEICDRYAKRDSRVAVFHQMNCGLVSARKKAVSIASGDYALFVDGDDFIEADLIEKLVVEAKSTNADVVISGHQEDLAGRRICYLNSLDCGLYESETELMFFRSNMLLHRLFSNFGVFSYTWGKLFSTDLLKQHQMEVDSDIRIGEDAACLYPLLLKSRRVSITGIAKYVYRQRPFSMQKESSLTEVDDLRRLYQFLLTRFEGLGYWPICREQLCGYLLSLAIVRADICITKGGEIDSSLFTNFSQGMRFFLYGAGNFGQHLARKLVRSGNSSYLGLVDCDSELYRRLGCQVKNIDVLHSTPFDAVVLAYVNNKDAEIAASKLISWGISRDKIAMLDVVPSRFNEMISCLFRDG